MVWFTRFTRFGDMHLVYGQERGQSCGPSSVAMCVAKLKKLSAPGAIQSEASVRQLYASTAGGSSAFVFNNSNVFGLVDILNKLQCGTWAAAGYSYDRLVDAVGESSAISGPIVSVNPVILRIAWTDGSGHFVVVDTIRSLLGKHYATVCDPWDANVHVTGFDKSGFSYKAKPALAVDLWGEAKHVWAEDGHVHSRQKSAFGYAPEGTTGTPNWIIYRT
jgi:hypothetical protein